MIQQLLIIFMKSIIIYFSINILLFFKRLLKLKDMMKTETGKKIAEKRHEFMIQFLKQFYDEWNGKC